MKKYDEKYKTNDYDVFDEPLLDWTSEKKYLSQTQVFKEDYYYYVYEKTFFYKGNYKLIKKLYSRDSLFDIIEEEFIIDKINDDPDDPDVPLDIIDYYKCLMEDCISKELVKENKYLMYITDIHITRVENCLRYVAEIEYYEKTVKNK